MIDLISKDTLGAIRPDEVVSYLQQRGWVRARNSAEFVARWEYRRNDDGYEVQVPLRPDFNDYAALIFQLVLTLCRVEQRSQSLILGDIVAIARDVFRFRSLSDLASDGTLPLQKGVDLVQGASDAVKSAAYAALGLHRILNQSWSKLPKQVGEYLQKTTLNQTERGSYIVSIAAPIPPIVDPESAGRLFDLPATAPFERTVSLTLAKALGAVEDVTENKPGLFASSAWEEAVGSGVSANLCESIVKMSGSQSPADVEVRLSWARNQGPQERVRDVFHFSAAAMPHIEAAGRWLRTPSSVADQRIIGYVRHLSNPTKGLGEKMVVQTTIENRSAEVNVILPALMRDMAITAYQENKIVTCRGPIVRHGRRWYIENLQSLVIDEMPDVLEFQESLFPTSG